MGRKVIYRQRIRSQAASVQAKSLLAHIASEIRAPREVSGDGAYLIALNAYRFLQRELLRVGPGQVALRCIAGRESHTRRARRDQPEMLMRVSTVAEEDASLLEEFGTRVMQHARTARVIEEAHDPRTRFSTASVRAFLCRLRSQLSGSVSRDCGKNDVGCRSRA
ncbi:MAG: hypothetical protein ACM3ZU_06155 [Bacteroidota bacterium]